MIVHVSLTRAYSDKKKRGKAGRGRGRREDKIGHLRRESPSHQRGSIGAA